MATAAFALDARSAISLKSRYTDAYRKAHTIIKLGSVIKMLGLVLATLIALGAIVSGLKTSGSPGSFGAAQQASAESWVMVGIGVAVAAGVGLLFFILGTFVCAQGQMLLASLDSAVNSSPLLDNASKANILLGHTSASSGMFTTSIAH